MRINNINNNQNNQNFKALSKLTKPLGQFYNANATLPTLIIESGVTLGRSYEANKRGGKIEATDRLVEQGVSALVWIYGVNLLKKLGDKIGQKFLKIKDLNFDVGFDELRNPIKNNNLSKFAIGFKASNILVSTLVATVFIGGILPKINNLIIKKSLQKEKNKNKEIKTLNVPNFKEYQNKTKKGLNFTSLYDKTVLMAHTLENNSAMRLFVTDTGVIAGRFHNANNKYRKIEGLFRDITSVYFYLLSTPHIVKGLNHLTSNANINPKALEKTTERIAKVLKDGKMSPEEFEKRLMKKANPKDLKKIDEMFKENKTIKVDDFIEKFPHLKKKALKMAQLQPIFDGNGVLSKMEAQDVVNQSMTSDARFLKDMFNYVTDGKSDDKLRYISRKKLEAIRTSTDDFMAQIVHSAKSKGKDIDMNFINRLAKSNIRKNLLFNSIGTVVSIFALGILIPKVQYAITKKLTNDDKFHIEDEK